VELLVRSTFSYDVVNLCRYRNTMMILLCGETVWYSVFKAACNCFGDELQAPAFDVFVVAGSWCSIWRRTVLRWKDFSECQADMHESRSVFCSHQYFTLCITCVDLWRFVREVQQPYI